MIQHANVKAHIHTYCKHTRDLSLLMYECIHVCIYVCMHACMHVNLCGRLLCSVEHFNYQCRYICHTSRFINPALMRPPIKWPTLSRNLKCPTCFQTWFPHSTNPYKSFVPLHDIVIAVSRKNMKMKQRAIRASPQLGAGWFTAFGSPGKKTQLISHETHIGAL